MRIGSGVQSVSELFGKRQNNSHLHSTGDTPTGTQIIGLP